MAGADEDEEFKHDIDEDDDDDEKASLKAPNNNDGGKDHNNYNNHNKMKELQEIQFPPTPNTQQNNTSHSNNKGPPTLSPNRQSSAPSLTRRMSSQFVYQVERQRSVVDNIGLTDKVNQYVPDAITQHIPGLNKRASQLKLTYFCHICFTKYPIDEGFTLRQCQHQFCTECLKGFMNAKINNGVVNLTCFHPLEDSKPCGEKIDEEDIHQIVSGETWEKYERFKANTENTYSRQCPYCDHTQNGDPEHPIMTCDETQGGCGRQYCLYHSNAHSVDMTCEAYELSIAKETRMNEMAIAEMGDNVKPCPQCKFRIIKNGGCNHMNCVKCGCSFCWLCMEIIEDEELPQHYKDENSPCKGLQFEGMETGPPPPRWIMALLVICMAIFCIPSTVLGIAFGCLCFPLVLCCDCRNESGERQSLFDTMFGCWLIWLIIFVVIAVFIPLIILYIIWEVIKALYGLLRICMPCLPECRRNNEQELQQQGGGNGVDANNNDNNANNMGAASGQALLSDVDNNISDNVGNTDDDDGIDIVVKDD